MRTNVWNWGCIEICFLIFGTIMKI